MTVTAGCSIAEASERTGVSVDTLRYYEKAGLMPEIGRAPNGQREYTTDDLGWIVFVRRLRATGMSVQVLAHYTGLVRRGDSSLAERRAIIEQHRETVIGAIDELVEVRGVLDRKLASYDAAERGEDLDCSEAPLLHTSKLS